MKARLLILAVLMVLFAGLGVQVQLTTDTAAILPRNSGLADTLEKVQQFAGAQTLLFEIDGEGRTREELTAAVHNLADALTATEAIDSVRFGYGLEDGIDIQKRLTPHSTAFIPADVLAERLSEEGIREILDRQLAMLATFQGAFRLERVKDDPLDLIMLATQSLAADAQPGVRPEDGLLIDASGERALLLAATTLPPGAIVPGDPRIEAVQDAVNASSMPVRWFGGHRMAYDTATAIATDVRLTAGLGILLLAGVLFLGFRTWRPLVGALGPCLVAAGCASAAAWWASPVHALQLGFSAALAGLAVDYWVHLYLAAAQRPDQHTRQDRFHAALDALRELLPALSVSAGSTAVAFGVLTTSSLPIVRVLGLTGAAAAIGAFLGTVLAGPVAWALFGRPSPTDAPAAPPPWIATVLLVATVLFGVVGLSGRFNADPLALVARSAETTEAERIFSDRYGISTRRAIVLVEGDSPTDALDRAKRVQDAFEGLGYVTTTGPTGVLPGPAAVADVLAAIPDDLQERLERVGVGVPLEGVAARIRQRAALPPTDLWTNSVLEPRVALNGNLALISVPLADRSVVGALDDTLWATDPDLTLTVPTELATAGMEDAREAILVRAGVGGALVFLLLSIRHRDPVKAALALAPAAGAVLVAAGTVTLSGVPWNPVSLAAMVPVLGLAVDYGVFMTETDGHSTSAPRAVRLSAATTLAGFLTLGLAKSPALFGVGVATVSGVAAAATIALYALPSAVNYTWPGPRTSRVLSRVAFAVAALFLVDVGLILFGAFTPPEVSPPDGQLTRVGNELRFGTARFARTNGIWLLSTEGDPSSAGYSTNQVTQRIRPRLEDEMFTTFDALVPNPLFQWIITRGSNLVGMGMHKYVIPEHQVEIRAGDLADPDPYWLQGSPYTRKIYYHAIHDLGQALVDTPLLACTGFIAGPGATSDGHWLLARNFDSEVGITFDRDKVVRVHRPGGDKIPFLSVAFAGLAGAVSGVNRAGIAVAINASASDEPPRLGTPMTLIVREILETATTLEQAEALLRARNGFLSENVLVVDAEHGKAALFEVTPSHLERLEVEGALAVTNHFRSPRFDDDATTAYRIASSTTAQRLSRMEELLSEHRGTLNLETGIDLLSDRKGPGGTELPRGHRHAINADIATHGVVIDATTRTVRISRYPNLAGGWVEVSLEDVLSGSLDTELVREAEADAATAITMRQARQVWLRRARRAGTEEALELSARALEAMPGHPEALQVRGQVLLEAARSEQGRQRLQEALAAPPEYPHEMRAIEALLK